LDGATVKYAPEKTEEMHGFSLVELMVALTIGLIILVAVSTLFVSSRQTYVTQDNLARLQENARFAMQFLVKDLRRAGYYGCVSEISPESIHSTLANSSAFEYNAQVALEGAENASASTTWYPSGTSTLPGGIIGGTDAITIRMADADSSIYIDSEMPNTSAELKVNSVTGLTTGDIIMVSDCASADIMQITQIQPSALHLQHNAGAGNQYSPGNATQVLSKAYSPSLDGQRTRVMKFVTRQYFIAQGASGNPALWRKDTNVPAVELVDGIESLQVLYGKNTDGLSPKKPNIYLKAGQAGLQTPADWSAVVAVRVGILARTISDKQTDIDNAKYDVDGDCLPGALPTDPCYDFTAPGDHYKRRVFISTVLLRNLQ
jgi:type IV pilus assembly protein PilW